MRPGIALYGGRAHESKPNPMQHGGAARGHGSCRCARWPPARRVGYGATYKVQQPSRIATIAVGYADGFLRALSVATGEAGPVGYIGDYPVPIVGRVSMDFITADVTSVPPELARRGAWVEVMGHRVTVDDLTDRAGTIGYELLSRLGQRVYRVYEGAGLIRMAKAAKSQFVCQNCGAVAAALGRQMRRLRRVEHARRGGRRGGGAGLRPGAGLARAAPSRSRR